MATSLNPLGLARQPIFDKDLNVVAYELLYHPLQNEEVIDHLTGDQEACQALISNFTTIFESGSLKTLPAFINVAADFIRTESLPRLMHHNLVVEVEKTAPHSPDFLNRLNQCVDAGYRIVLNDCDFSDEYDALLRLAQIIRVDIKSRTKESIENHLQNLLPYNLTLLAKQVTSQAEFEQCYALGFRLFQGPFLSQPTLIEGKTLTSNQTIVIHLLAALQDSDVTAAVLSDIISRDPQLTFNLLRIVNSARFNLPNKIDSLRQAIVALGLDEINKWATLLALSSNDDKPSELIRQILMTARMCEFIAEKTNETSADQAFICGVLSMLDALLQISQNQLLEQLPLSEDIAQAITQYEGQTGKLLQAVNFYMIGQPAFKIPAQLVPIYNDAYYEALRWSNEAMNMMENGSKR